MKKRIWKKAGKSKKMTYTGNYITDPRIKRMFVLSPIKGASKVYTFSSPQAASKAGWVRK